MTFVFHYVYTSRSELMSHTAYDVDINKFEGWKSELLNIASHSTSALACWVSNLNKLTRTKRIKDFTKELVERLQQRTLKLVSYVFITYQ